VAVHDDQVVFHDLAVPGSLANVDHLVIGATGVFVMDSRQWTDGVHQRADELAWHNHYPLERTLETVRWQAEAVGRLLGTTPPLVLPTSMAVACMPRAWPSCMPACSAAGLAMTGASEPPPGPRLHPAA